MADATDTLVRLLEGVARTADEIRNGVLLGRAERDVRLEPLPVRTVRARR